MNAIAAHLSEQGTMGFKRSYAFERHGAVFAFGGQNGKAMLSLPSEACAVVGDWNALASFLKDGLQARITRWDGAVDDFHGERTVNDAVRWYRAGGFTAGGNCPLPMLHGNWLTSDTKGRTFYVGKRGNGKLMRIYEKGSLLEFQRLRQELPEHLADMALFSVATGLRQANVKDLEWQYVDIDRMHLWIPGSTRMASRIRYP